MCLSILMPRPTSWRCCLHCSAAFSLVWFRFVKCSAPIPGRSSARDQPVSAACDGLLCATCCLPCKSPFAPSWSPPRWLRRAAWNARFTVIMVSSPGARCWFTPISRWPDMTAISDHRCSDACSMLWRPSLASPPWAMPTGSRSASAAMTHRFSAIPPRITDRPILLRTRSSSMSHLTISVQPQRRSCPGELSLCTTMPRLLRSP